MRVPVGLKVIEISGKKVVIFDSVFKNYHDVPIEVKAILCS